MQLFQASKQGYRDSGRSILGGTVNLFTSHVGCSGALYMVPTQPTVHKLLKYPPRPSSMGAVCLAAPVFVGRPKLCLHLLPLSASFGWLSGATILGSQLGKHEMWPAAFNNSIIDLDRGWWYVLFCGGQLTRRF